MESIKKQIFVTPHCQDWQKRREKSRNQDRMSSTSDSVFLYLGLGHRSDTAELSKIQRLKPESIIKTGPYTLGTKLTVD